MDINYPVRATFRAQPGIDKERICVIKIILRKTGKSMSVSVW